MKFLATIDELLVDLKVKSGYNCVMESGVTTYLESCRSTRLLNEMDSKPPDKGELKFLIADLRSRGLNPIIVGSVAIATKTHPGKFRTTSDVDLYVDTPPGEPPEGWEQDMSSPGVISWFSPSRGQVDFLVRGDTIAGDIEIPQLEADDPNAELPILTDRGIFLTKLNTTRLKDIMDLVMFGMVRGSLIPKEELGELSQQQQENYETLQTYFDIASSSGLEAFEGLIEA